MKRLLVFLLFFVMIGATPIWADSTNSGATTNTQTNTRVAILLLRVDIQQKQLQLMKVVLHQTQPLQILQTHIQVIVEL